MTKAEIIEQLTRNYGDAALFALETSCVVEADYTSYDHVLTLILPALEEEMSAQNGDLG